MVDDPSSVYGQNRARSPERASLSVERMRGHTHSHTFGAFIRHPLRGLGRRGQGNGQARGEPTPTQGLVDLNGRNTGHSPLSRSRRSIRPVEGGPASVMCRKARPFWATGGQQSQDVGQARVAMLADQAKYTIAASPAALLAGYRKEIVANVAQRGAVSRHGLRSSPRL